MSTGMASAGAATALDNDISGTVYVKLHTGDPGSAATSNAATNTTRAAVTFAAASGATKTSNADASWTTVSTTETYTHFSIWSASSGGTFLFSGTVSSGSVTAGNDFKIASGSLVLTLSGAA